MVNNMLASEYFGGLSNQGLTAGGKFLNKDMWVYFYCPTHAWLLIFFSSSGGRGGTVINVLGECFSTFKYSTQINKNW